MSERIKNSAIAFKFHDSQHVMSVVPYEYSLLKQQLNYDPMELVQILEESNIIINEFDNYTISDVNEESWNIIFLLYGSIGWLKKI